MVSVRIMIALAVLSVAPICGAAHGGGLDALGCHNDRKRGGYHCHRGELAGMSFSSKADAQQELQSRKARSQTRNSEQKPSATPTPAEENEERTVYTTASGKKYHGAACAYLSKSRSSMLLKDAKKQGYTPCEKCNGK